jgi:serine/threonine-protein phosphatase 6 regulatory ankyrin repeat subunit B
MTAPSQTIDLIAYNFNIESSDFFTTLQRAAQPSLIGESYLHTLAREGDALTMELLLADGAAADHADAQGNRPLHEAARCGHLEVVALLLDHGARADAAADPFGVSPLMLAVENGHLEVARYLLRRGAQVGARNRLNGQGVLHLAAAQGNLCMIGALISAGAGVFMEDRHGQTPRDHAARNRHRAAEKALIKVMTHQARYLH